MEVRMQEKRKYKRIPADMKLEVSSLFRQDNEKVENINAPIQIFDISKGGIGFFSESNLPVSFYFNATITLGDEDSKFFCIVKIVRKEENKFSGFAYGCEIVGLAPVFNYIFDNYSRAYEDSVGADEK